MWKWLTKVPVGYRKLVFSAVATGAVCLFALALVPAFLILIKKYTVVPADALELLKLQKETFVEGVGITTGVFGVMNLGEWALRRLKKGVAP